jgi:hypothetical protein
VVRRKRLQLAGAPGSFLSTWGIVDSDAFVRSVRCRARGLSRRQRSGLERGVIRVALGSDAMER